MSSPKPSIHDLTKQSSQHFNIVSLLGAGLELRCDTSIPDGMYLVLDSEKDEQCRIYRSNGDPHGVVSKVEWNALPLAPANFHMLRTESEQKRVRDAAQRFIDEHTASAFTKAFNPAAEMRMRMELLELFACKLKAGYLDYAIEIIAGDKPIGDYPMAQGIKTRKGVAKWCRMRSARLIGRSSTSWGVEL